MGLSEEQARQELKLRLGAGARHDAPGAPARALEWARRGTAYFARKLNELTDSDIDGPSLLPGWTRRHVIAHVGYNARALARLVEGVRTGVPIPIYYPPQQWAEEIEHGATLPARALRNLFQHSEVHLNVEWRDLPTDGWVAREVPVADTALMRAIVVWTSAVDLGNGASFADIPPGLRDILLAAETERGAVRMRSALSLQAKFGVPSCL